METRNEILYFRQTRISSTNDNWFRENSNFVTLCALTTSVLSLALTEIKKLPKVDVFYCYFCSNHSEASSVLETC